MIIRSQDKKLLIPLEKFAIGITKDHCVCATSNVCVAPAEISAGLLGKYSTEEKAIKVLGMIESKYTEGNEWLNVAGKVFQMPQDNEVN